MTHIYVYRSRVGPEIKRFCSNNHVKLGFEVIISKICTGCILLFPGGSDRTLVLFPEVLKGPVGDHTTLRGTCGEGAEKHARGKDLSVSIRSSIRRRINWEFRSIPDGGTILDSGSKKRRGTVQLWGLCLRLLKRCRLENHSHQSRGAVRNPLQSALDVLENLASIIRAPLHSVQHVALRRPNRLF